MTDVFHAREHLWKIGKEIYATDKEKVKNWVTKRIKELDQGEVEKIIAALKRISPVNDTTKGSVEREINYGGWSVSSTSPILCLYSSHTHV